MPNSAPRKSEWKPAFLATLKSTANVSRSASEAGVSRQMAYKERETSEHFRAAWDDAIEEGLDYLEEEARRRAYEGTLKPVFNRGMLAGHVREFSDTLTIFLLKGRRPQVYGDRLKQEVTGKDGGPVEHKHQGFDLAAEVRRIDEQLAREEEAGEA